jgi:hypothetical protein
MKKMSQDLQVIKLNALAVAKILNGKCDIKTKIALIKQISGENNSNN